MKLLQWISVLAIVFFACAATAQSDDVGASVKRVTPKEEEELRAVLAEPVPKDATNIALTEHFKTKRMAAQRLGEFNVQRALYEQWMAAQPENLTPKNELANLLDNAGRAEESIKLRQACIDLSNNDADRAWYRLLLGWSYKSMGKFDEAQQIVATVKSTLPALRSQFKQATWQPFIARIEATAFRLESVLFSEKGKSGDAVDAAENALKMGREALKLLRDAPDKRDTSYALKTRVYLQDLSFEYSRLATALRNKEFVSRAEEVIKENLRLAKEEELEPRDIAGIYGLIGFQRYSQREFVQTEQSFRAKDLAYAKLGYEPLHPWRASAKEMIASGLMGQKRWAEALKVLDELDELAKDDEALKKRVRFRYTRGYVYLGNKIHLDEAVSLMAEEADSKAKVYPLTNIYVVQARGLQGVALWRQGDEASQSKALPLLKQAVHNYMLPDNAGNFYGDVKRDARDLIFATYLDAVFNTPGANPLESMAAADWVRGGSVQEALGDAALRSAIADPTLANLARQEQDAKNEIEALRKFLAGEEGGSKSPLPEIASKMRDRIAELEKSRAILLEKLKAGFPDFDGLVRPKAPEIEDMVKELSNDEALVMLLPTDDAVYVWALNSDGNNSAVRVAIAKAELAKLVGDMRKSLDFAEMGGYLRNFNAVASSDLYQKLLKPVEASFAGKKHLIVAAGGALGQIPFGVLLTQPVTKVDANSPWLIKQAAITHIPSLSAWLAVKQFAKAKSAPESLDAWGDPQFNSKSQVAANDAPAGTSTRHVVLTRSSTAVDLEKEDPRSAIKYSDIPALPETRDELLAMASILKADTNRDLHLGAQASKASVLDSSKSGELQKKKVVAFATHGLMAGDLPHLTQPALALASTGNEDKDPLGALLTLDEVLNLKLNADWVILSACNTAAADGKADEALSGLARGFFYAGSRSLLVTHWAVESESAKELTTNTMKNYMANPTQRKAESLRQAMLTVMAEPQYQHPAYWAPYALVGDGGR